MKKLKNLVIIFSILFICCSEKSKLHVNELSERDLEKYYGRQVGDFLDEISEKYSSYNFGFDEGILSYCEFIYKKKVIDIHISYQPELEKIFRRYELSQWKITDFIKLKIHKIEIVDRYIDTTIHNELINDWIDFQFTEVLSDESTTFSSAYAELDFRIKNDPEIAWQIILKIFETDKSNTIMEQLAAGPLQDFIIAHGEGYIVLIEKQAQKDQNFAVLLGGLFSAIHENKINGELRKRIQGAWNLKGWGGLPVHRITK